MRNYCGEFDDSTHIFITCSRLSWWFSYDDHDPRVWCDILNFDRKVYFNNIYDCMLTKNECDFIWKVRHGAIPTGRFLYW